MSREKTAPREILNTMDSESIPVVLPACAVVTADRPQGQANEYTKKYFLALDSLRFCSREDQSISLMFLFRSFQGSVFISQTASEYLFCLSAPACA
jgi:hypothetical protein